LATTVLISVAAAPALRAGRVGRDGSGAVAATTLARSTG